MNVHEAAREADRRAEAAARMVERIDAYHMDGLFHGVTVERAIREIPWPTIAVGYDGWSGGFRK